MKKRARNGRTATRFSLANFQSKYKGRQVSYFLVAIVWYVLPRLQEPRTCCGLAAALWAGGVGLFIVCRLQYGIEPSLSRHVGVVSVDTAKPFAAVLPPMSTYSKATKRVDLRQCKDNPFFVPRNTKWSVKCGRWSKKRRGSRSRAAYLPVPPTPHWPQGLVLNKYLNKFLWQRHVPRPHELPEQIAPLFRRVPRIPAPMIPCKFEGKMTTSLGAGDVMRAGVMRKFVH